MSASIRVSIVLIALSAPFVAVACNDARSKADLATTSSVSLERPLNAPQPAAPADNAAPADFIAKASEGGESARRGLVGGVAVSTGARASRPGSRVETMAQATPPAVQQEVAPGSMLIRTGQASLQVDSLEIGIARVRDVARRTGAIVANTSMEGGREQTRAASLELRIPSERFDEAVNGLSPIGKLESVNVSVQDVGEEYVDVEARVANARRLEQRLVELLANRTGKLSDVLTVERELARVREEIERYEGRMRYLRSRASVSTLSIALHEPFPIVADRPGARPIRDAFVQAWRNFVGLTAGIIASLGVLIPLGLIIVGVVLIGRRVLPRWGLRIPKTPHAESA